MPSARSWPGRLPQLALGADDVEDVVTDLEDHAEAVAELGEGLDLGARARPPVSAPMRHRRGHQRGRLAGDGLEVVVLGPRQLEGGAHLGHLSLAEPARACRASSPAISVPRPAAMSAERASRKSPATMATRFPKRLFTLSTLRRMVPRP